MLDMFQLLSLPSYKTKLTMLPQMQDEEAAVMFQHTI